jgi:hypothetical protein
MVWAGLGPKFTMHDWCARFYFEPCDCACHQAQQSSLYPEISQF